MSYLHETAFQRTDTGRRDIIKTLQQPEFPLVYDHIYGPYKPITTREASLHRNFINLLLTNPGEWPMRPGLGIGLRHRLFAFPGSDEFISLKPQITGQLQKYLPQVKLLDVKYETVPEDIDNNKMKIILVYSILNTFMFASSFSINSKNEVFIEELDKFEAQSAEYLRNSHKYKSDERTA